MTMSEESKRILLPDYIQVEDEVTDQFEYSAKGLSKRIHDKKLEDEEKKSNWSYKLCN